MILGASEQSHPVDHGLSRAQPPLPSWTQQRGATPCIIDSAEHGHPFHPEIGRTHTHSFLHGLSRTRPPLPSWTQQNMTMSSIVELEEHTPTPSTVDSAEQGHPVHHGLSRAGPHLQSENQITAMPSNTDLQSTATASILESTEHDTPSTVGSVNTLKFPTLPISGYQSTSRTPGLLASSWRWPGGGQGAARGRWLRHTLSFFISSSSQQPLQVGTISISKARTGEILTGADHLPRCTD